MTRHKLSKHFTIEEFDCHDGTRVPPGNINGLEYLCRKMLEPLRAKFGTVTIVSGFRTESHNRAVGGEPNSYHRYDIHDGNDQAADVVCARGNAREWHSFLNGIRNRKRNGRGGLGLYVRQNFVHVDIRDFKADWRG